MQNFLNGMTRVAKSATGTNDAARSRTAPRKPAAKGASPAGASGAGAGKSGAGKSGGVKNAKSSTAKQAAPGKRGGTQPKASGAKKTPGKSDSAKGASAAKSTAAKGGSATSTSAKTAAEGASAKKGGSAAKKTPAGKQPARAKGAAGGKDPALTEHRLPLVWRVLILLAAFAAMVGFAVVLSKLTLAPSAASESLVHSNLRPGDSIRDYLAQPALRDTLKQLGGNVVLGMPFGVLLPALVPRTRGLLRVMAATALVMLLVELVQGALVQGRAFDIDDVILNTTGSLLGYLVIGRRLGLAVHPRRRHWWHRLRPDRRGAD